MKLEKREITLNECDSLKDVSFLEKSLLNGYVESLSKAARKETRNEILQLIKETGEEWFLVLDLLKDRAQQE